MNLISVKKLLNPATKSLGESYVKAQLLWNPLIIFIFCAAQGTNDLLHRCLVASSIAFIVSNFCFGLTRAMHLLDLWIAQRKGRPRPVRSRAWHFSISAAGMPMGLFVAFTIMNKLGPHLGPALRWQMPQATLDDYRFGLILGSLIAGLFFLIQTRSEARNEIKNAELKLKKIENERLQAQISALTAQMNPHLLFNTLNTVASLISTEPGKAEDVIIKLSELYRGVLDSSRNLTHPLETEVGICRSYLAIEQARFGSRLRASIDIAPEVNSRKLMIPALSLQPLIENAVKHGLSPRASGGEVRLTASNEGDRVRILIQDNGVGFNSSAINPPSKLGAGVGLKNCQERFKLHFGDESRFEITPNEDGGTSVLLTLPSQSFLGGRT